MTTPPKMPLADAKDRLELATRYQRIFRGTRHETPQWQLCEFIRTWGYTPEDLGVENAEKPILKWDGKAKPIT